MINMTIIVGKAAFKAKMYDNETTRALITQLPMTVNMSELNGQEKYYPEDISGFAAALGPEAVQITFSIDN
ncbi:cyclophilin-like fold protein [Paenibacillus ihuae]|uniref:cyclophilin-like fold protein n=1 Tax=Paenibacillus ihuae TaxID=1232431 RepID=UPI0006D5557A|nr:cyclophilin-like fold protein [Paenibacillus ihuae]